MKCESISSCFLRRHVELCTRSINERLRCVLGKVRVEKVQCHFTAKQRHESIRSQQHVYIQWQQVLLTEYRMKVGR